MSSNITNTTNQSIEINLALHLAIDIIFQFDAALRFSSAFVHLFYFYLVFKVDSMRKRTHIYLHHSILIGFLFNLHYLFFYNFTKPNFGDAVLNAVICNISEELWTMLKNLRTYSIALIALYRFIGVFKTHLYKEINKSIFRVLLLLFLLYVWLIIVLVATKYGFGTTYGSLYCFDGYSPNVQNSLNYFIVQSVVGFLLPTLYSLLAYVLIKRKLNDSAAKTKIDGQINPSKYNIELATIDHLTECITNNPSANHTNASFNSKNMSAITTIRNISKDKQSANQLIIMNILEMLSCLMVIGLGMRYLFPSLNDYYNVTRFLLRFFNLLFQAIIPVTVIVYNPMLWKAAKKCVMSLFICPFINKKIGIV